MSAVKMTDSKKKNTNTMKITTKTIASIINGELDPADYDLCWTINNELMEWTNTSYSKSAGGRFASDDIRFVWSEINKDFGRNVTNLLNNEALNHAFSISVKYFIDYNQVKKLF